MLPTLSIKGDLFIKLNQLDSAKYYLEISKNDRDFYAIANYHNDMSNLEEKLGNYRKALDIGMPIALILIPLNIRKEIKI